MPFITTISGHTGHWTKTHRSLARFSGPDPLLHTRSLVDFITTTSESRFSVHTGRFRLSLMPRQLVGEPVGAIPEMSFGRRSCRCQLRRSRSRTSSICWRMRRAAVAALRRRIASKIAWCCWRTLSIPTSSGSAAWNSSHQTS